MSRHLNWSYWCLISADAGNILVVMWNFWWRSLWDKLLLTHFWIRSSNIIDILHLLRINFLCCQIISLWHDSVLIHWCWIGIIRFFLYIISQRICLCDLILGNILLIKLLKLSLIIWLFCLVLLLILLLLEIHQILFLAFDLFEIA